MATVRSSHVNCIFSNIQYLLDSPTVPIFMHHKLQADFGRYMHCQYQYGVHPKNANHQQLTLRIQSTLYETKLEIIIDIPAQKGKVFTPVIKCLVDGVFTYEIMKVNDEYRMRKYSSHYVIEHYKNFIKLINALCAEHLG